MSPITHPTALAALLLSTQAQALNITWNKSTSLLEVPGASAALDAAADYYMRRFSDPVNVSIDAEFAPLSPGTLGLTEASWIVGGYSTLRDALVSDQAQYGRPGDITERVPTAQQFNAYIPSGTALSGEITLTSANAKALGFEVSGFGPSDGLLSFDSYSAFDFDPTDGISAGMFDFTATAVHEIGHILGFYSAVDDADCIFAGECSSSMALAPTTLDLFRLEPGAGDADFTNAPRILTTGASDPEQVLYVGDGIEYAMATGEVSGDGQQASHWKDDLGIGLFDATLDPGEYGQLSAADLRALDLIGWDAAPVPLPASGGLLLSGLIGLLLRRRAR